MIRYQPVHADAMVVETDGDFVKFAELETVTDIVRRRGEWIGNLLKQRDSLRRFAALCRMEPRLVDCADDVLRETETDAPPMPAAERRAAGGMSLTSWIR